MLLQPMIGFAEVAAAKEAAVRRKWRWMRRLQYQVLVRIYQLCFVLRKLAPQHKHHMLLICRHMPYHFIGKGMPSCLCVRIGSIGHHRERGIEQQYTVLAHGSRLPVWGMAMFRSLCSSLKILTSEGGGDTPSATENDSPCACPAL